MSDVVIVVAVTDREARSPAHGISLFLVENGTKGFIKGRKLNKIGLKAQVSSYNLYCNRLGESLNPLNAWQLLNEYKMELWCYSSC